ncbi:MAG: efflux RND transporter periplasmic adaptor subunit [Bryobacterales bacterium]|nr:efflux RND transporter periplasmic adaptor subunit [Bryobacterales bacterium]
MASGPPFNGDASPDDDSCAPFAYVVIKTEAAPGDVTDLEQHPLSVADLSRVYVEAQVHEKDFGRIRINQPVFITVDSLRRRDLEARVAAIMTSSIRQTRARLPSAANLQPWSAN